MLGAWDKGGGGFELVVIISVTALGEVDSGGTINVGPASREEESVACPAQRIAQNETNHKQRKVRLTSLQNMFCEGRKTKQFSATRVFIL